jgi:hypothetical protein
LKWLVAVVVVLVQTEQSLLLLAGIALSVEILVAAVVMLQGFIILALAVLIQLPLELQQFLIYQANMALLAVVVEVLQVVLVWAVLVDLLL